MNEPLNLKRSFRILRQHWITFGLFMVLGFGAGAGIAALDPPMYTTGALVVLPDSIHSTTTQALIAASNPVLASAAASLKPAVSPQALSGRVQVSTPIAYVLSIEAEGKTAAEAVDTANAVADSYVAYISAANIPGGQIPARVLQHAVSASKTWLLIPLLVSGSLGALAAGLAGVVLLLAVNRGDRRLRQRDEIADAIGVPVLASVPVRHPANSRQWTGLLDEYEPDAVNARRLRHTLDYLSLAGAVSAETSSGGSSLTVLAFSADRRALALGPQLAVFAATQGILTTLVIDGRQNVNTTAALRAACATAPSSRRSSNLRTAVANHDNMSWPDAALTVVVAVVDRRTPQVRDTIRTSATVLGVSTGLATADQLARVAASAAADDRYVAGILMADPDPADPTTGRLPQLGRRVQIPTRVTRSVLVTRR